MPPGPEHTTHDPEHEPPPRAIRHSELLALPQSPQVPLVETLIHRAKTTLVYGPSNVGKSWAGLHLASQLAKPSGSFLGHETHGPARTLMLLSEDDHDSVRDRYDALAPWLAQHEDRDLIAYDWPEINLDEPAGLRRIDALVRDTTPDLVIIDNLTSLCAFDFSDSLATRSFLHGVRTIRDRHGSAFAVFTHPRKGGSEPRPRSKSLSSYADAIFGSQVWRAMTDSIIAIEEHHGGDPTRVVLRHVKQRNGPRAPTREFHFHPEAGVFWRPVVGTATKNAHISAPGPEALLAVLANAKVPVERNDLRIAIGCSRDPFRRNLPAWIEALRKQGHNVIQEGGHGRDGALRFRLA